MRVGGDSTGGRRVDGRHSRMVEEVLECASVLSTSERESSASSLGFAEARGEIIATLNLGVLWLPQKFAACLQLHSCLLALCS